MAKNKVITCRMKGINTYLKIANNIILISIPILSFCIMHKNSKIGKKVNCWHKISIVKNYEIIFPTGVTNVQK